MPRLSQRKASGSGCFRPHAYDNPRNDIAAVDTVKYSSEEGDDDDTVLPGYGGDGCGYYPDENASDAAACHEEDEEVDSGIINRGARIYGRGGGLLGQSRLRARMGSHQQHHHRGRNRMFQPPALSSSNLLDFNRNQDNIAQRGLNFNKINPSLSTSTSTADLALGSKNGRSKYDDWPHPASESSIAPAVGIDEEKQSKTTTTTTSSLSSSLTRNPGIQNLGNTCYLSASLQALFSIPHFIADLYKTYVEQASSSSIGGKKLPLTKALLELAAAIGILADEDTNKGSFLPPEVAVAGNKTWLWSGGGSTLAVNPAALKKQMDVLTDKFVG